RTRSRVSPSDLRLRAGYGRASRTDRFTRRLYRLGLEARLDEAVMQQPLRIEERQSPCARAEDDHQELLAAMPCGNGQVVAGLLGEAGLECLHTARIAEERNVARVDSTAIDERLAAEQRTRHRIILDQPAGQHSQVPRVAALDRVGQTVRIGE